MEMDSTAVINNMERRNKGASKEELKNVLQDLVQMVTEIDPAGATRDFSVRKSFVYYDPYNPEVSSSFAHLKFEDDAKLRASLVVQQHIETLDDIESQMRGRNSRASVADIQRFEAIRQMLDRLNDMKIIDAQVLLKLYNMYRYQVNDDESFVEATEQPSR